MLFPKNVFIFFLCVFSTTAYTQNIKLTHYSEKDGLLSDVIYYAIEDKNEHVWFATSKGISKFNGIEFKNFNKNNGLKGDSPIRLAVDEQNRLWYTLWNTNTGYINEDTIVLDSSVIPLFKGLKIQHVSTTKDSIYFFSENGYLSFDPTSKKNNFVQRVENDLIVKNNKAYYGNLPENGVAKIKIGAKTYVVNYPSIPKYLSDNTNTEVTYYNGFHYISHHNTLLEIHHLKNPEIVISQYVDKTIIDHHIDDKGKILSTNKGVYFIPSENYYLTSKDTIEILPPEVFGGKILKGKNGGYWFTTVNDGVYYAPSLESVYLKKDKELEKDIILDVFSENNALYVLYRVKQSLHVLDTLFNSSFYHFNDNANRLKKKFLKNPSSQKGEVYFQQRLIHKYNPQLKTITTEKGSSRFEFLTGIPRNTILKNLSQKKASKYNITPFKDHFYFNQVRGAYAYFKKNDSLVNLGDLHPVFNAEIKDIKAWNTTIVFSIADKGLAIYSPEDGSCTLITEKDGLAANNINHIQPIVNELWLTFEDNINTIKAVEGKYEVSTTFHKEQGLLFNEITKIIPHGKDNIAVVNKEGISILPGKIEASQSLLPITISYQSDSIFNKWNASSPIKIDYTDRITLTFETTNFRIDHHTMLYYKINKNDDEWQTNKDLNLKIAALPYGKNTIVTYLKDDFGNKSKEKKITINVTPPFWATWWFYLLIVLLIIFSSRFFFRLRIRKLQQQNLLLLEKISLENKAVASQMNPHFLFNTLNSIQEDILASNKYDAYNYLEKFSKLMRKVLNYSELEFISLKEEIDFIESYIELEQKRFGQNAFEFEIKPYTPEVLQFNIPSMLLQPYIENAITHGLRNKRIKGKISVSFSIEDTNLVCTITDNGIGRKNASKSNHRSFSTSANHRRIASLNKRSAALNKYAIEYTDLEKNGVSLGTEVKLIIPYENINANY